MHFKKFIIMYINNVNMRKQNLNFEIEKAMLFTSNFI